MATKPWTTQLTSQGIKCFSYVNRPYQLTSCFLSHRWLPISSVPSSSPSLVCSVFLPSPTSHPTFPSSLHSRLSVSPRCQPLPAPFLLCGMLFCLPRTDYFPPTTHASASPSVSCPDQLLTFPSSLSKGQPCAKPDQIICTPLSARRPQDLTPQTCTCTLYINTIKI